MLNEFSRTELLIGKEALKKLKSSKVAVFGIGGVGTYAAEGLARAGIGRLVLVDNDRISVTNINRQLHAAHSTVGRPKVEVMKERILDINPAAEVAAFQSFYLPGSSEELLKSDYDYVVDAVDTVAAKIDLVVSSKRMGIPVISSMGAGNKLDPSRFEVADIYSTSVCPLARVMRKRLKQCGVDALKVVYSRETPLKPAQSEEESATAKRRIPGSISFVPSVAGLIIAGEVVRDLIGYDSMNNN